MQHLTDTLLGLLDTQTGNVDGILGAHLQVFDDALDLLGRLPGLARKSSNFIRHHGKTASLLTCARGLNSGIERQQVGLIGNRPDHAGRHHDFLGLPGQIAHRAVDLVHRVGQQLNGVTGGASHQTALFGQLVRGFGLYRRVLNMHRHFGDRRGHFGHGGRGHVRFSTLLQQSAFGVAGQLAGVRRRFGHLVGQIQQAGQCGFQARLFADQNHVHPSNGTIGVAVHPGADRVRKRICRSVEDVLELLTYAAMPPDAHTDKQRRREALRGQRR